MKNFSYTITAPQGIHARPAGMLAREAQKHSGTVITIEKEGSAAKATQLMRLMGMGVKQGDAVTITAEGGDETAAIAAMQAFFREYL